MARSHPEPEAFREQWDQAVSNVRGSSTRLSESGNPIAERLRQMQQRIESGFPSRER